MKEARGNSKFENVDDLIIGSGAGGFTAAAALAQAGRKVLVVEQHTIPGGWSQSYRFNGHSFSPGVHDIAELGPGGRLKEIYEGLGMGPHLTFYEMNPDGYDHIILGDQRIDIPSGKKNLIDRFSQYCPHERDGFIKYFNVCEKIFKQSEQVADINSLGALLSALIKTPLPLRWSLSTGEQFVNAFVKDPIAKALLYGQAAGHYALPPSQVSAVIHAAAVGSYINGAWHPKGGGRGIVRAFLHVIRKNGGDIVTGTPVEKIIIKNGRAIGVLLGSGQKVLVKNIISNADPNVTFGKLVGNEHLSSKLRRKLERTRYSSSGLCLTVVTDSQLDLSAIDSGNYWYYNTTDIEESYKKMLSDPNSPFPELPFFCLTTNSLRDPERVTANTLAFEIFTFMKHDAFNKWNGSKHGQRAEDYMARKEELTKQILVSIDKIIPRFSEHVVAAELATPLTNVHYTMSTGGNFYGTEKSRFQIGPWGYNADTEIPNLKLCGASTFAHGVVGSSITGLMAAAAVLKKPVNKLLKNHNESITYLSAEVERKKVYAHIGEPNKTVAPASKT